MCNSPHLCLLFPPSISVFTLSILSASSKFVQRRALFDSVSLVIQGSMEGEMSLMDNLSGSICHYYALPPKPSKHSTDKKVNSLQKHHWWIISFISYVVSQHFYFCAHVGLLKKMKPNIEVCRFSKNQ